MAERPSATRSGVALIGGRYELVRELGADDDALVWEGFDASLERRVIVRLLRPELADDPAAAQRFWQAARSAARSGKTGERVLDGGTDPEAGRVFVVREWPEQASAAPREEVTRRLPELDEGRGAWFRVTRGRVALVALLVIAVVGLPAAGSLAEGWLAWIREPRGQAATNLVLPRPPAVDAQPDQAAPTPSGPAPTATPAPSRNVVSPTSPAGAATPRATPTRGPSSGTARRIVNTDGRGVALRASPGGDRLPGKGYDEGATVDAFESSGDWTRIRGSDGREGWVLSVTLGS
jgi:hypothetical protein